MSNIDVIAYALANGYTDETVIGGGAIKGSPCTIKSKTAIEGGTRIIFAWTLTDGSERTQPIDVMNGVDGKDGKDGVDGKDGIDGKDGSQVSVNAILNKGTKIGEITVDGHKYTLYAPAGGGGGGDAVLTDDLTTAISVGGIDSGTEYEAGTPLETIIRDMLEPTLYPTLTNPTASMTATGAKLLETGATLNTTFTLVLNRGSINPQYTAESSYRSGSATSYTLDGTSQVENTFSITVTEAKKSYQGSVAYGAGVQPKDSKGNNYNSPLPAGSVNTNTINYEFVDALWANTGNIANVAKLALVSKSAKQKDFAFPAQTVANPEIFDVPASWSVTAVQVKNDLSGAYEDAISQFTVTDVTHDDASGTSVAYKRYTFNLGYDTGARSVRLKWN